MSPHNGPKNLLVHALMVLFTVLGIPSLIAVPFLLTGYIGLG